MSDLHRSINRRTALLGGMAATGAAALPLRFFRPARAQAGDNTPESPADMSRSEARKALEAYGFLWSATSPSTHEGDTFTLTLANRGTTTIKTMPRVMIMDHTRHYNLTVIEDDIELPAGESREFSATNDYGAANHFATNLIVDTGDPTQLGVTASIRNAAGAETASFNELAFWIKSFDEVKALQEEQMPAESEAGGHDHTT